MNARGEQHRRARPYYSLVATWGDDAFDMEYLETGPGVWRGRVRKRRLHREAAVLQENDASCCGC